MPPPFLFRSRLDLGTQRLRLPAGSVPAFDPVPIEHRRASVPLILIQENGRDSSPVDFRVDTGAGMSQMSLARAVKLGIRVAGRRGFLDMTTATGSRAEEVIAGAMRAKFPGSDREFLWHCLFFVNRPRDVPPLLGLWDVVNVLQIRFDNTPAPGAPYGVTEFRDY